jgi:NADPH:quinone reductase-like Zn-dependent oxidoreductase
MIGGSMKQILKSIFFGKLLSLGSKKMRFLSMKANKTDLEFIANMAEKNQIRSIIEKTYPLEKLALAIETVALGRAKGKVVITIQ